ncbi:MAG: sigma-70 family RNA polymerase sigma factor [Bacteroidota bacterium]
MLRIFRKGAPPTDSELIQQYQRTGQLEVLGELYERYMELVYGVCLKYFKEQALAEDAVIDIFEQLTEKVKQHTIGNFKSWLYTLARNHCLMQLRKKQLTTTFEPEFMQSVDQRHHTIEIELDALPDEVDQLEDCIQLLKGQQKECIELFYLKGTSYKAIAEQKGETVGQIRSYIQNGRRNLRKCMEDKTRPL